MSDASAPGAAADDADRQPAVRAVVAAHGDFAAGLVSAVEAIAGAGDVLRPLTNHGCDRARLLDDLRAALDSTGAMVVFTDLPAGSWTMAARRLQRERPELVVVSGASLPALLDFALSTADARDAARQAIERGRSALALHECPAPVAPAPPAER